MALAMMANNELLKALSPEKDEIQKIETTLRNKRGAARAASKTTKTTAELKDLISSSVEDMAGLLAPDHAGATFVKTGYAVSAAEEKIKRAADNVFQLEKDDETE